MDIRIVLLPDENGKEEYVKYSKILNEKFPCEIMLGNSALPHITLIHVVKMNDSNFGELKRKISEIASVTNSIILDFKGPRNSQIPNFIGISFTDNEPVENLRNDIHAKSKSLFSLISDFQDPHITITKVKNEEDSQKALNEINNFPLKELVFDKIAICENGENGTVPEALEIFELK